MTYRQTASDDISLVPLREGSTERLVASLHPVIPVHDAGERVEWRCVELESGR
jgi:hypothetical protein